MADRQAAAGVLLEPLLRAGAQLHRELTDAGATMVRTRTADGQSFYHLMTASVVIERPSGLRRTRRVEADLLVRNGTILAEDPAPRIGLLPGERIRRMEVDGGHVDTVALEYPPDAAAQREMAGEIPQARADLRRYAADRTQQPPYGAVRFLAEQALS